MATAQDAVELSCQMRLVDWLGGGDGHNQRSWISKKWSSFCFSISFTVVVLRWYYVFQSFFLVLFNIAQRPRIRIAATHIDYFFCFLNGSELIWYRNGDCSETLKSHRRDFCTGLHSLFLYLATSISGIDIAWFECLKFSISSMILMGVRHGLRFRTFSLRPARCVVAWHQPTTAWNMGLLRGFCVSQSNSQLC